jgi:hypothetical protein
MTTIQSLITARATPPLAPLAKPLIYELPTLSPSLDPRAIPVPPEGDATLEIAAQALGKAQKAGNDMLRTAHAIFQNEMLTPHARHVEVSKASTQISKPGLQEIDRAHTHLNTAIEALTKATHAPPAAADMRSEIRHTEIRAALARMNATDRGKALGPALEENDTDVLAAALNGSRITSGMTKLEIDAFRHRWRHTAHATEMKKLETLEKARDALMLGGKILCGSIGIGFRQRLPGGKAGGVAA